MKLVLLIIFQLFNYNEDEFSKSYPLIQIFIPVNFHYKLLILFFLVKILDVALFLF